jgi:hypothetical protein
MADTSNSNRIYKVLFLNQGKVYELYARYIGQGEIYGFIEIEELIFGEQSKLVVNPSEERLQAEFAGVRRSFVPIHSVIRIDEVEKEGISKIRDDVDSNGNVTAFPFFPGAPGQRGQRDD